MSLKRVTAPANYPVTLDEAKAYLKVEADDDDLKIETLIAAATGAASSFTGRALIDQTWDYYADEFPDGDVLELPLPPLISVTGVYYLDGSGAEQTLSASEYVVDDASQPARVVLNNASTWPTTHEVGNAVRVRFRAGYIDATDSPPTDDVPFEIRAAILLQIADLYDHPGQVITGTVTLVPWIENLLRPFRVHLSLA